MPSGCWSLWCLGAVPLKVVKVDWRSYQAIAKIGRRADQIDEWKGTPNSPARGRCRCQPAATAGGCRSCGASQEIQQDVIRQCEAGNVLKMESCHPQEVDACNKCDSEMEASQSLLTLLAVHFAHFRHRCDRGALRPNMWAWQTCQT